MDSYVKCNIQGEVLWQKNVNDTSKVFIKSDDTIITVGTNANNYEYTYENLNILIQHIDKKGEIINSQEYGGSLGDFFHGAVYEEGVGLVLVGYTNSFDSPFTDLTFDERSYENGVFVDRILSNDSYVAFLNEDFELLWVNNLYDEKFEEGKFYRYDEESIELKNGIIQLVGCENFYNEDLSTKFKRYLQKININGDIIFTKKIGESVGFEVSQLMIDEGETIVSYGNESQGKLLKLDENGEPILELDLNYWPNKIMKNKKGQLILSTERSIGFCRVEIFRSSLPVDTELILESYDEDFNLLWRKVFDEYKEKPFEDSVVIID